MSKYKLKDKVVVITGSTGGLGLAIAQALQAKGAKGELNSHFPMTSTYQKMLTKWEELEQKYELSEEQILQIIRD